MDTPGLILAMIQAFAFYLKYQTPQLALEFIAGERYVSAPQAPGLGPLSVYLGTAGVAGSW